MVGHSLNSPSLIVSPSETCTLCRRPNYEDLLDKAPLETKSPESQGDSHCISIASVLLQYVGTEVGFYSAWIQDTFST